MRTFEHFDGSRGHVCPICGNNADKETIFVRVLGTEKGNIAEAAQVHTECLQRELVYRKDIPGGLSLIYAPTQYPYFNETSRQEDSLGQGGDSQDTSSQEDL
jgi:hypothetical protein